MDNVDCFRNKMHVILAWASLVTQTVNNLPAIQETPVRSLGQEDPLEKEMATLSSSLALRPVSRENGKGLRVPGKIHQGCPTLGFS